MATPFTGSPAARVAIVTGGSPGGGLATGQSLAGRGYMVVVNYLHDQSAAESAVDGILADNGRAVAVRADVADELDVQRLFAETIETFGGIDVVVHAVGCRVGAADVADVGTREVDALCRVTRAALLVNREAARRLRAGGAIVNVTCCQMSPLRPGYGPLAMTGAGVDALTRVLALELSERDITVNAVLLRLDEQGADGADGGAAAVTTDLLGDDGHRVTGHVLPAVAPRGLRRS